MNNSARRIVGVLFFLLFVFVVAFNAFAQDEIELTVSDDGAGFPGVATNGDQTGYGVRNMRERARRMGGRLTIHPRPGGGTVVAISVPLDADVPAEADGPGSIVDHAFTR